MSVPLYMDVHVKYAVTRSLRARGVDVWTAQEDGATTLSDPQLLDRALELGRLDPSDLANQVIYLPL